jgi:hypothetical protein
LREVLAGEDPGEVASLLADAAEAADGMGRPLFSGRRADGRPQDAVHCLWWACGLVREHRGDSHVAAAAAAGLNAVEMNILTELWTGMPLLSYTATRGWPPDAMQRAIAWLESRGWVRDGGLTDAGRAGRLSIEQRTDDQEQPIAAALGDRLEEVCGRLNHWGAAVHRGRRVPSRHSQARRRLRTGAGTNDSVRQKSCRRPRAKHPGHPVRPSRELPIACEPQ